MKRHAIILSLLLAAALSITSVLAAAGAAAGIILPRGGDRVKGCCFLVNAANKNALFHLLCHSFFLVHNTPIYGYSMALFPHSVNQFSE